LRDIDTRREPEHVGQGRHAGAADVLMGDHEDRRGDVGGALFLA
jgi:hypothetical protein